MKACSKCGCTDCLTEHHIHPVTFYGRKNNQLKVCLCRKHHDQLEQNILAVESFIGNVPFGRRFKLHKGSYEKILEAYIHHSTIIHVST